MNSYSIEAKPSIRKTWMERFKGNLGNGTDGISAVTYSPITNTWFFVRQVSSNNGQIYEYDNDLNLLRTITEAGDWHDTESINWMYDDVFLVTEENRTTSPTQHRANIVRITGGQTTLNRTGSAVRPAFFVGSGWFNANLGVEGMVWDKSRDKYYFTYEKAHASSGWYIWEMDYSGNQATRIANLTTELTGLATDVSDMWLDQAKRICYVLSDEGDKLFAFSLSDGKLIDYYNTPIGDVTTGSTAGFGQPEGVAFNLSKSRFAIAGENRQGGMFHVRKCGRKIGVGVNEGVSYTKRYF